MLKTEVLLKALVVNEKGEILILRRSETDERRPLQWDLPGGHLDEGEEMLAGVEREIFEETALSVTGTHAVYSKTEVRHWKNNEANIVFILYAAHAIGVDVKISYEHSEFAWKRIEEAIKLYEYPTHIEFLAYVIEHKLVL